MLAGQAADQACAFGIKRQVVVPECLVAGFGDTVKAVATAVVQGGTKGRLACGDAQQQGFGSCAMASKVDQRRTDDITAQFAGSDTHRTLESMKWAAMPDGALAAVDRLRLAGSGSSRLS
ncbi:hypothetical protein D3C86_1898190 [compost metagenome]